MRLLRIETLGREGMYYYIRHDLLLSTYTFSHPATLIFYTPVQSTRLKIASLWLCNQHR